ncbi:hypothetical protein D3Z36_11695 [Lachnospiraceae bacterium]|nr:hypothetical protein [Lachnospiraceae bacterium]
MEDSKVINMENETDMETPFKMYKIFRIRSAHLLRRIIQPYIARNFAQACLSLQYLSRYIFEISLGDNKYSV